MKKQKSYDTSVPLYSKGERVEVSWLDGSWKSATIIGPSGPGQWRVKVDGNGTMTAATRELTAATDRRSRLHKALDAVKLFGWTADYKGSYGMQSKHFLAPNKVTAEKKAEAYGKTLGQLWKLSILHGPFPEEKYRDATDARRTRLHRALDAVLDRKPYTVKDSASISAAKPGYAAALKQLIKLQDNDYQRLCNTEDAARDRYKQASHEDRDRFKLEEKWNAAASAVKALEKKMDDIARPYPGIMDEVV